MEKIKSTKNIEETEEVKQGETKSQKQYNFEEMFAAMKKQMDEQAAIIKKQNEAIAELTKKSMAKPVEGSSASNDTNAELVRLLSNLQNNTNTAAKMVKVIHLDDVAQAMFKLQNGKTIKFTKADASDSTYGKIVPVSEEDALLLLNEYESSFVRGALKFDEEHQYLLRDKGIDVDKINYNSLEDIEKFETLSNDEITKLYSGLKAFQKDMLKAHIVDLIRHNKVDEALVDRIKHLNRLSKKEGDVLNNQGSYDLILEKLREGGLE